VGEAALGWTTDKAGENSANARSTFQPILFNEIDAYLRLEIQKAREGR
jgi:hypothetical protein